MNPSGREGRDESLSSAVLEHDVDNDCACPAAKAINAKAARRVVGETIGDCVTVSRTCERETLAGDPRST